MALHASVSASFSEAMKMMTQKAVLPDHDGAFKSDLFEARRENCFR